MDNHVQTADRSSLFKDVPDESNRERLTDDALKNIQKQIEIYKTENYDLRLLQKNTETRVNNLVIENKFLGNELFQNILISKEKVNYKKTIESLESIIAKQKSDQIKYIKENKFMVNEVQRLKNELREKGEKINENAQKFRELEEILTKTKKFLSECTEREKSALQKVHEALYIAERAVEDKLEAEKTIELLKEECSCLASTIGKVMDEAAIKVNKDVEVLKKKFSERERFLFDGQEKLKSELERRKILNSGLETCLKLNKKKNLELMDENKKLIDGLEITKTQLMDYKMKIDEQNKTLKEDIRIDRRGTEDRIKAYVDVNKHLKEKYKKAVTDLIIKFKSEICRLQNENAFLKLKNKDACH